ncbi:hypothetical protein EMCRGX_G030940 [Ephydatia muelleri]
MSDVDLVTEFEAFGYSIKADLVNKVQDLGTKYSLQPNLLCDSWVAFALQHGCVQEVTEEGLEKWESQLESTAKVRLLANHTPVSRSRAAPRTHDISRMIASDMDMDAAIIGTYASNEEDKKKLGKRMLEETTPTTPVSKARHISNGASHVRSPSSHDSTVASSTSLLPGTPGVKYSQRQNAGNVACVLNEEVIPSVWRGTGVSSSIGYYNADIAIKEPYKYMFQKASGKALAVVDRISAIGAAICHAHGLSDRQQPLSMPSEETAVYVGRIMCDGEGQLNAKSCLLDGPTKRNRGCTVKMDLPDSITCSLFPGQVVAVEGVNMYSGVLIPSNIYEGTLPPLPQKSNFSEFTMVMAAGPFTTSDNLEMEPLQQLMRIVVTERPDVLILCGPFVDLTHDLVKDGNLDVTFEDIFRDKVLSVLTECAKQTKTSIVMLPSLKDAHHQYPVYPQPPFQFTKPGFHMASDPSTLAINGLCVGITSTDVLFHLSARTMFRGAPGDRMATLVGHVLKQQSYYPLQPTFVRENQLNNTESDADHTGVNMDLSQQQGLELPVKPDILFLPSDLKPFAKVVSGCVCINPGRLTKMAVGGTYCKIAARHRPGVQQDLSTCIGVQIVHI